MTTNIQDMTDQHLRNRIKWVINRSIKGITGSISNCDSDGETCYETEELIGFEVLGYYNFDELTEEARKRNLTI